jgi:hypothetical protein
MYIRARNAGKYFLRAISMKNLRLLMCAFILLILAACDPPDPSRRISSEAATLIQTSLPTIQTSNTLSPDETLSIAESMIKTNGGCAFPCWLGIIPGKTTWREAYKTLAPFSADISPEELDSSGVSHVDFQFPDSTRRGAYLLSNKEGIVSQIESPEDISLPDLLTDYGPPSDIRIHAIGVYTMDPVGRYILVLMYQERGFMAVYDGENEKSIIIHICPNKIKEPQHARLLWPPTEKITFSDTGKKTLFPYSPEEEEKFIPLETLTGLSVESFYERYKDPANQGVCMEIQSPDWP